MRFWCPTWLRFGAKLAPKIRKTWPKCTSKTHRFFSSLLALIFVRFGLHLGGSLDALFVRFSRMVRSISAWSASWCSDLLKLLPKRALRIPRINFAMIFNPFFAMWAPFWRPLESIFGVYNKYIVCIRPFWSRRQLAQRRVLENTSPSGRGRRLQRQHLNIYTLVESIPPSAMNKYTYHALKFLALSSGALRTALELPGAPRRAQEFSEESRSAQELPGEPRRAQKCSYIVINNKILELRTQNSELRPQHRAQNCSYIIRGTRVPQRMRARAVFFFWSPSYVKYLKSSKCMFEL